MIRSNKIIGTKEEIVVTAGESYVFGVTGVADLSASVDIQYKDSNGWETINSEPVTENWKDVVCPPTSMVRFISDVPGVCLNFALRRR